MKLGAGDLPLCRGAIPHPRSGWFFTSRDALALLRGFRSSLSVEEKTAEPGARRTGGNRRGAGGFFYYESISGRTGKSEAPDRTSGGAGDRQGGGCRIAAHPEAGAKAARGQYRTLRLWSGGGRGVRTGGRENESGSRRVRHTVRLWLVADELAVPALGLAKGPRNYPLSAHGSALGSHLVYGAAAELVRSGLRAV